MCPTILNNGITNLDKRRFKVKARLVEVKPKVGSVVFTKVEQFKEIVSHLSNLLSVSISSSDQEMTYLHK